MPVSRTVSASRGALYIYASLVLALLFGLGSSSLSARLLTEPELGGFRLVISVVSVAASALTFGMLSSAGSLLAGNVTDRRRDIVWQGSLAHTGIVAVGCSLVAVVVAIRSGTFGSNYLLWILGALLSGSIGSQLLLQETLRAEGQLSGIAVLNGAPPALFMCFLVAAWMVQLHMSAALCVVLYFLSQGIVAISLITSGVRLRFPRILPLIFLWRRNRSLGLNVYWASFLGALTAQAGIFALQHSSSMAEVGLFALAITVSAPLALLPSAIGTAYFRRLAEGARFPPSVLRISWLLVALLATVYFFAVPYAVQILYGTRYLAVIEPARLCGVAALLHGMGDVYNRYYLANRRVRFLLGLATIVCLVAIVASFVATAFFGLFGAGIARLLASGAYVGLVGMHYHFNRYFGSMSKI